MSKLTKYINSSKSIKDFFKSFILIMGAYWLSLFIIFLINYNSKFNPNYFTLHSLMIAPMLASFIHKPPNNPFRFGAVLSFISTIMISIVLKVVYSIGGF